MRKFRNRKLSPIANVIETHFRKIGAENQLFLYNICTHWKEIVGARLFRRSYPKSLKDGRLVVTVTDPGWMTQMKFMTHQMKNSINKLCEKIIVGEIFLVVGHLEDFNKEKEPVLKDRRLIPEEKKLIAESTEHVADQKLKEVLERIVKKHLLAKELVNKK
jgi:hypothetical protein